MADRRGLPAARPGDAGALEGRIRWLMTLRLSVAGVMLLVSILLQLREGTGFFAAPMRGLYLFAGLAFLLTIVYAVLAPRVRDQARFAVVQLAGDLVLISGVVLITGGAGSPFLILYFLIIIGASTMFYRPGSLVAAGASSVLYGAAVGAPLLPRVAALLDPEGTAATMSLAAVGYRHLLAVFGFFLVAFLASHLAESLRRVGRELDATSASLAELERRSEHILQCIASGLVTTDLAGRITYCNRAAERIAQISGDAVVGRPFTDVFRLLEGPDPWEARDASLERAAIRREARIAGGREELLLGMTFSPLRDEESRLTGVICAFQDLTRIRRMEEQVRRSDRLAAVGELAAGMAHEIRNPLASLSGSITMLREELELDGTVRELMDIVTAEVGRLDGLVTDFLGFASPREPQLRPTDLGAVLRETATLLRQARPGAWQVEVTEPDGEPVTAEVDPQLVRQVCWNLSLNAIEAMPAGGVLEIALERGPEAAVVAFADQGAGLSPEAQARMFTPFFSTKERGSGLGLAIVFKIVEAHGGRIEVENRPGAGATFRVTLPLRRAAPALAAIGGGA